MNTDQTIINHGELHCLYDELVSVDQLKVHPKNKNIHSDAQIERLAKILKYQGWRYPIKVSKQSGFITSGHGRLSAAKLAGWTHVPVNFQHYDNNDQELADVTSDNAIASWAELDIAGINANIGDWGPDFDLELLGMKNFVLDPSEFKEPNQKADPTAKDPELKTCPNCGVIIE